MATTKRPVDRSPTRVVDLALGDGAESSARAKLAAALLPHAEALISEYAGRLPAEAVTRCLEAAMSGAILMRLDGRDAVTATVAAAREDCNALLLANEEAAAS